MRSTLLQTVFAWELSQADALRREQLDRRTHEDKRRWQEDKVRREEDARRWAEDLERERWIEFMRKLAVIEARKLAVTLMEAQRLKQQYRRLYRREGERGRGRVAQEEDERKVEEGEGEGKGEGEGAVSRRR